jgi:hypothetical protein
MQSHLLLSFLLTASLAGGADAHEQTPPRDAQTAGSGTIRGRVGPLRRGSRCIAFA